VTSLEAEGLQPEKLIEKKKPAVLLEEVNSNDNNKKRACAQKAREGIGALKKGVLIPAKELKRVQNHTVPLRQKEN
jgi:hypothetical protein